MRARTILHLAEPALRIELCRTSARPLQLSLGNPDRPALVMLDLYGIELLAAFILNARLLLEGDGLADEHCVGPYGCRLHHVSSHRNRRIEIHQQDSLLSIAQGMWDRLYAELALASVHARHVAPFPSLAVGKGSFQPRILH